MLHGQPSTTVHLRRHGIASIEFLLFIPILLGFAIFIAWSFHVETAVLQAGIDAEAKAALNATILLEKNQFKPTEAIPLASTSEIAQLSHGFAPSISVGGGIIEEMATRETGNGFKGITRPIGDAVDGHLIVAHAWESHVFAFPVDSHQQPPLTLPTAVRGIAPMLTNFDAFSSLAGLRVSTKAKSENAEHLSKVQRDLPASVRDSQAALRDVLEDINSLKRSIAFEEAKSPVDKVKLSQLQADLKKHEEYREQLQKAIQNATLAHKINRQSVEVHD